MCLGVPGLVVEAPDPADDMALTTVEFAGIRRKVCLACVPEARPGDYVIVHAGFAISRIDPVAAGRVLEYLRAIGESEGWDDEIRR